MTEDELDAIRARDEAWAGREHEMRTTAPIAVSDRHDLLAVIDIHRKWSKERA